MARERMQLYPELQKKVEQLERSCELQGLKIGIGECVRSAAEQDALYAIGRTTPGRIVTNAKGSSYSSMHQWGVAFDFYRNDGKGAYVDTDGFFAKVGELGKAMGLEWGGSWKSPVDKPHFQLRQWGSTARQLKAAYQVPDKFRATWQISSGAAEKPSGMEVSKQVIRAVQAWLSEYTADKLLLDGVYNKDSKKSMIKAIEKSLGMQMSGIATEAMYSKIIVVRQGSTGDLVKCLQALLFVHGYNPQEFSGNCTAAVAEAIGVAQREKGLVADRLAGKNTFKILV